MSNYTNPLQKKCLRCGYGWWTRWRYLPKSEQATEPKRCARCRSPLWNTPKTVNSGPVSKLEMSRAAEEAKAKELLKSKSKEKMQPGLRSTLAMAVHETKGGKASLKKVVGHVGNLPAGKKLMRWFSSMPEKSRKAKIMPSLRAIVKDWKKGKRKARR